MKNLILILSILAALLAGGYFFAAYYKTEGIQQIVEEQLEAIKTNKLTEAYYAYTSTKFQAENSFQEFKEFVRSIPILQSYTKLVFTKNNSFNDIASTKVMLFDNNESGGELFYHLIKENNRWKILTVEFFQYQKDGFEHLENTTKALIDPVDHELASIKERNFLEAYKNYTTKAFREKITYDEFKNLLQANEFFFTYDNYVFKEHFIEGNKGLVVVVLNPEKDPITLKFGLEKEDGRWKILGITLSMQKAVQSNETQAGLIATVKEQLEAFQKNDIEKGYGYLAKSLQSEIPLTKFRGFILAHPAFYNHTAINVTDPYIEDSTARLTLDLHNEQGTTEVNYELVFEEGAWKIEEMRVEKTPDQVSSDTDNMRTFKTRELVQSLQNFLNALREKDIQKAYNFVSSQFQENTTMKMFEEFLKKHPEFINNTSSSFEKLTFNNQIATFIGKIYRSESAYMPVEFDLIEQNGSWKILHIFTMPVKEESKKRDSDLVEPEKIVFTKLVLGNKINEQGLVLDPKTSFEKNSGDIYVNLYIHKGKAGTPIKILFKHMESGSNIPQVNATLTQDGDSILSFVFSPPSTGWPKGSYQIRVSNNDAIFETYSFRVNK